MVNQRINKSWYGLVTRYIRRQVLLDWSPKKKVEQKDRQPRAFGMVSRYMMQQVEGR